MMKLQEVFEGYRDYIMPTYTKAPLVFVKGKGSYLWDIHHKKYLDFFFRDGVWVILVIATPKLLPQ